WRNTYARRVAYLSHIKVSRRRFRPGGRGFFIRSTTMGELSGKVPVVTGASKGIGAAIALRFAGAGAAVAVNYSSDRGGADRVVEEGGRGPGEWFKGRRTTAPSR